MDLSKDKELDIDYDEQADVLYTSFGKPFARYLVNNGSLGKIWVTITVSITTLSSIQPFSCQR